MEPISLQSLSRHPAFNSGATPGPLLPQLAHQVGLAAFLGRDQDGTNAALAAEHGISRQSVWALGREVEGAWERFQLEGGRCGPAHRVCVDRPQLVRATVGTRAETPASLRDLMKTHEHFYGLDVSFGFVQGVIADAEAGCAEVLKTVDLTRVEWITLDELFVHSAPILVGMDLDTGYLFCLHASESRDAQAWKRVLDVGKTQGLSPTGMTADSGKGLVAGARLSFENLVVNSDLFHCKYECLKVLSHLERRAYKALEAAEAAEKRRLNARDNDNRASLGQLARRADEHAGRAMTAHDRTLKIVREVFEQVEAVELQTGALRDAGAATRRLLELAAELKLVPHARCRKLATWIKNQAPSLCSWIAAFGVALGEITPDPIEARAVQLMTWMWRLDRELALPCNRFRMGELRRLRGQAVQALGTLELDKGRLEPLLRKTVRVIEHRRRASSLVECLNSVLRPWLTAHKRVTQGALDLFAAWWNLHPRQAGKLRGSCPYTALTGLKVLDWLSLIGCPPSVSWS